MIKLNLTPFFEPKSVVIIGASRNEFTFNYTLVKNLREARYRGKLFIVHPEASDILGVKCYNDLKSLPDKPELAILLLSHQVDFVIEELGQMGIKYCMIESDLSGIPSEREIIEKVKNIADKYEMLIMGPSMIGIINSENYFTSSIIPVRRHIIQTHKKHKIKGSLSFLAQSGGLSGALGWWSPSQPIPISKVIHTGKSINVTDADVLQYLFDDPDTAVISLYLREPDEKFAEVMHKNCHKKPVLYKIVGKNEKIQEQLKNCSAIEVDNYIELFEFAKVVLWCPPPKGDSIGIVGPSSGAILLLIAEMRKRGIHLAKLTPNTREAILEKVGGSTCLDGNPVDYWPPQKFVGTDVCSVYYISSHALLDDQKVDALFLALEFFSEIEFDFDVFKEIKKKYPDKPIITILIQAEKEGRERIISTASELEIPVFVDEVERAIRAYSALIQYYRSIKR